MCPPDDDLSPPRDELEHRRALAGLTLAIRRLCDASVSTRISPDQIDEATHTINAVAGTLEAEVHDGPYSGLMGRKPDFSDPHRMLPLSPIVGPFNPIAPDLALRFDAERVVGTATLSKKHVGPPNAAHGGIGALLADQLVALGATAGGLKGVTRELKVRYRRPTPLFRELELEGWCEDVRDERAAVKAQVRCEGRVTIEAEGEIVVAPRVTHPRERVSAVAEKKRP